MNDSTLAQLEQALALEKLENLRLRQAIAEKNRIPSLSNELRQLVRINETLRKELDHRV